MASSLGIFIACIGAGLGAETVRRYSAWRKARLALSPDIRNGPVINDRSVGLIHFGLIAVVAVIVAWLLYFVLLLTGVIPQEMAPI